MPGGPKSSVTEPADDAAAHDAVELADAGRQRVRGVGRDVGQGHAPACRRRRPVAGPHRAHRCRAERVPLAAGRAAPDPAQRGRLAGGAEVEDLGAGGRVGRRWPWRHATEGVSQRRATADRGRGTGDRLGAMDAPTLHRSGPAGLARLGDAELHHRLLGRAPLPPRGRAVARRRARRRCRAGSACAAWNVQRGRRPSTLATALRRIRRRRLPALRARRRHGAHAEPRHRRTPSPPTSAPATSTAWSSSSSGLGDETEQRAAAGARQRTGPPRQRHRVAGTLGDPAVVRLPDAGLGWFAADSPQPRVGGRMAVRRHRRHRRRRRPGRLDPPREPHRRRAPGRADGGAPAGRRRAGRRRSGHRRRRLQHAGRHLRRAVRPPPGTRPAARRADALHLAGGPRAALRGGAGARLRVDGRQRRRADDRARRRRAARPRADPAGLALRARPGGPPPGRRPGRRPVGPSRWSPSACGSRDRDHPPGRARRRGRHPRRRRRRLRRRHPRRATRRLDIVRGHLGGATRAPLPRAGGRRRRRGGRARAGGAGPPRRRAPRPSPAWPPSASRRRTRAGASAPR